MLIALLLACQSAFAQFAPPSNDAYVKALQKRLSFIFNDEELRGVKIGAKVVSLTKNETLWEMNGDTALSPASSVKVLTALVALRRLGPDYTFQTEVYVDGPIEDGTLKGNLYLKGSGDPSLVTERLYLLADLIRREDVRRVQGSIVVDDSTFDVEKKGDDDFKSDRAYTARPGGLSFNYNTTSLFFRAGSRVGENARVFVSPDTGFIRIKNTSKTVARGGTYSLVASRVSSNSEGDVIEVKGSIPLGMPEQHAYFSIGNPSAYAGKALKFFLEQQGIKVTGDKVEQRKVPLTAKKITQAGGLPLREIVTLMNKFSNNFIAATLIKTLGREVFGAPGTTENGMKVVVEEATKIGVNTSGFHIVSGSGLTRDNTMTAHHFTMLFKNAFDQFDVLPELFSSLPIAGRDGTLRDRMVGTPAFGRLRGKTGTLDGVSSLAGVVESRGGELLSFAVLMNNKSKSLPGLRRWQNYLGQALADFNRQNAMTEKPPVLSDTISAPATGSGPPAAPEDEG